jgi:HK97 family phage major capsid protein
MHEHLTIDGAPLERVANMSRAALLDELGRWVPELERLAARGEQQSAMFGAVAERCGLIDEQLEQLDRLQPSRADLRRLAGLGSTEPGARFGPSGPRVLDRGNSARDDALRRIDSRRDVPDPVREAMTRSVDDTRGPERDRLAHWIAVSADPAYERALSLLLADPTTGPATWSDEERAAVRRVQDAARAMSLAPDSAGGFLVGATTDYSIMLTTAGQVNPVRALARKVSTAGDSWAGITSAGAAASWDAEAAEVSDDSPTLGNPVIPVHKAQTWIQASWEVASDAPNLAAQLAPIFADARDVLEADTLTTAGTGTGMPRGLIPAIVATPGSVVVDNTASPTSVTVANATALQNAVPPRWRANAAFMANLTVMNMLRAVPSGSGLTTPALGSDGRMLGWQVHENSNMDGTITGSQADYLLVAGDFSQYVVVDRIGMTITPVPMIMGPNQRPTSQVGWLARWRMGADIPTGLANAFRLLNLSA